MTATPYVGKTDLEYVTAQENILLARGSRLTNFNPGSRISSLIRSIAKVLAEGDVRTQNGFEYAIREGVYNAFGFQRLPGLKAVGIVRVEHTGHTVPLNIPIFTIDLFGLEYESIAPITIPVGQTFAEIEVRAKSYGTDYNITRLSIDTDNGLGTVNVPLPPNTWVWNPSDFAGGTNIESEESRLRRWRAFIISLGRSTPLGIYNAAVSIPGVAGVQLTLNKNPFSDAFEIGWINLYISDGTSNPPASLLNLVRKTIEGDLHDPENFPGYAAAGTYVFVAAIPVIGISVKFTLEIVNDSQLTDEQALTIALNQLTLYINTLPVGYDVLLKQVEGTILKAHADFYKVTIVEFYAKLASDPIPVPLPLPADLAIPNIDLPRTGGTSGGTLNGTVTRTVPT